MPKGPATHDTTCSRARDSGSQCPRDRMVRCRAGDHRVSCSFLLGGFWAFLRDLTHRGGPFRPSPSAHQLPPEPRLQVSPPSELRNFRLWEEQTTAERTAGSTGSRGVVRIPVDRAMDLILERGIAQRRTTGSTKMTRAAVLAVVVRCVCSLAQPALPAPATEHRS